MKEKPVRWIWCSRYKQDRDADDICRHYCDKRNTCKDFEAFKQRESKG